MNLELPNFKRVMRGYDTEAVEQSWVEMGRMTADLNATNKELKLQLNSLREQNAEWGNRLKNYEKMEIDLRDALLSAQRIANQVKEEAKLKAEEILGSAKIEAEMLLNETRENIQNQEEKMNGLLQEHQGRISILENEIIELTTRKEEIKQRVERTISLFGTLQTTLQDLLSEEAYLNT